MQYRRNANKHGYSFFPAHAYPAIASLATGLLLISLLGMSKPSLAQHSSSGLLYCCIKETGVQQCGDRPSFCWGKEYRIMNTQGQVVKKVPRPQTQEELAAIEHAKNLEKKQAEEKKKLDSKYAYLISLYGNVEKIDSEIERQRKENEGNIKLAESRLLTARENVEVFKRQNGNPSGYSEAKTKEYNAYLKTVTDIETEISTRTKQFEATKARLLLDKDFLTAHQPSNPYAPVGAGTQNTTRPQ